jgi:hypothetical protein
MTKMIIRLKRSTYTADAVFHLFNTGETTTEWIGFPKNATGYCPPGPSGRVMDFIRFAVAVNGTKVPLEDERNLITSVRDFPRRLD